MVDTDDTQCITDNGQCHGYGISPPPPTGELKGETFRSCNLENNLIEFCCRHKES